MFTIHFLKTSFFQHIHLNYHDIALRKLKQIIKKEKETQKGRMKLTKKKTFF